MSNLLAGHIRFGIIREYAPADPVTKLVAAFRLAYPGVTIDLQFNSRSDIEKDVIADNLDVGLLPYVNEPDFFETFAFTESPRILAASSDYVRERGPFDQPQKVVLADLVDRGENYPEIRLWTAKRTEDLDSYLDSSRPAVVAPDYGTMKRIVASGLGIGLLPREFVADELAAGSVQQLMPDGESIKNPLFLATRRKRHARNLFENVFLEYLLDHAPNT